MGFNTVKPPFDNPVVRQAFAAATDRRAVVAVANQYLPQIKAKEATSFIPPEVLGQDLTGCVGIPYDPDRARELLLSAGYSDPETFPPVTLFMHSDGPLATEYLLKVAEAIANSWRKTLGVEVVVSVTTQDRTERFNSNPPDIYHLGWAADYNDPDNFFRDIFLVSETYHGKYNLGKFTNADFSSLVEQARIEKDRSLRQILYIQADKILVEQETAIIPLLFAIYNMQ